MQPQLIDNLNSQELSQIAGLHYKYLNDSFINNFGKSFLEIAYKTIIIDKNNIFLVIKEEDEIIGYLVATKDGDKFNDTVINNNFFSLSFLIVKTALLKPIILLTLIKWFLTRKSTKKLPAELQFIVIKNGYQGKGLGTKLIAKLEEEFKKINIAQYRVGTKANNEKSNNFYIKLGFKYTHSEKLFGDKFNYYLSPTY